jgi:3-mercaptopyruvate sulfurtransferase SseA
MLYGSRGNMVACRLALLLLYMGINRINVLDGGLSNCPNHDEIDASF